MWLADSILSEPITISITVEELISWLIVGLIAGFMASIFFRGRVSLMQLIIIGLLGAVVGGFLAFEVLKIPVSDELEDGITIRWIDIMVSFFGALVVMVLTSSLFLRRDRS